MGSSHITVGSLYAGVGGICLGFKNAGFQLSWANEFDKYACVTYRANFNHILYEGDVMELPINELGAIDVLTAGFPCQPFSVAGYKKGFNDDRGNHFFKILEFIDTMRPKAILLENVKNLVGHDKGNTFKVIKKELTKRDYSFNAKVLNTKDYGNIPHNRERIFIVCFDKKTVKADRFEFPKPEPLGSAVVDMLESDTLPEKYYYLSDRPMYSMLAREMKREDTVYQYRRVYVRENKSNVCPTLTANMGTGGHNVPLIKTKKGIRKLTPRECFRFQGFPDSFKLPEIANCHLYKQAGNSVSVPVIERLAREIKKVLIG